MVLVLNKIKFILPTLPELKVLVLWCIYRLNEPNNEAKDFPELVIIPPHDLSESKHTFEKLPNMPQL